MVLRNASVARVIYSWVIAVDSAYYLDAVTLGRVIIAARV